MKKISGTVLKEKGIANTFWVEAFYIVICLLNRCATKATIPNQDQAVVEEWKPKPRIPTDTFTSWNEDPFQHEVSFLRH